MGFRPPPSAGSGIRRVSVGGNLGATYTLDTNGDSEVALVDFTLAADGVVTATELDAAKFQRITLAGQQDGSGGRSLSFDDGSGPVLLPIPQGAGAAFEVKLDWTGTDTLVDGVGDIDASTTAKGVSKLSTAPASAANPIAVGDNDSRLAAAADLAAHLADGVDAHDASAVSTTGIAGLAGGSASDVQTILAALKTYADSVAGGVSEAAAADIFQPRFGGKLVRLPFDPWVLTSTVAPTVNQINAVRAVMPETGTLSGLWYYSGGTGGNVVGMVFDTGDADPTNHPRTKLWDSGSLAVGSTGWVSLGNPALAVTRGQQLDLAAMFDNASALFGRTQTTNASVAQLPTGTLEVPGAALPKLNWTRANGSMTPPASVTEANCVTGVSYIGLVAVVT